MIRTLLSAALQWLATIIESLAVRVHPKPWGVFDEDNGVHVVPINDDITHPLTDECLCGPRVEFIDPDTDEAYENGPLVCHHSLDGRELAEIQAVRRIV